MTAITIEKIDNKTEVRKGLKAINRELERIKAKRLKGKKIRKKLVKLYMLKGLFEGLLKK